MATSLLNKLTVGGSNLSSLDGTTPSIPDFALSKLHDTYSINNIPFIPSKPSPSQLDLNGAVPAYNYRDNTPEGMTF
jgi:hypothetical protein|tara:strand:- start:5629 stop:5859 length:231 start_codon:yes stop_codon:yes gene_type:complete